jgi:hypothetical protein
MRILLVLVLALISQPSMAGCESSILEGSHTALTRLDAKTLAWEEAKDACFPGEASKLSLSCNKVKGDKGVEGKPATHCVQQVTCTLCDEGLRLKYEALD